MPGWCGVAPPGRRRCHEQQTVQLQRSTQALRSLTSPSLQEQAGPEDRANTCWLADRPKTDSRAKDVAQTKAAELERPDPAQTRSFLG